MSHTAHHRALVANATTENLQETFAHFRSQDCATLFLDRRRLGCTKAAHVVEVDHSVVGKGEMERRGAQRRHHGLDRMLVLLSSSVVRYKTHRSRVPAGSTFILESRRGPLDGTWPGDRGVDNHSFRGVKGRCIEGYCDVPESCTRTCQCKEGNRVRLIRT